MPDLLVVIKCKRKLLIMAEDVTPHIRFHFSTHYMSIICDVKVTEYLQRHKTNHRRAESNDGVFCGRGVKIYNLIRYISDNQRDYKRYSLPNVAKNMSL